jgi:PAS domain S-box-containing protein
MKIFPLNRKNTETHNMRDKIVIIETLIFVLPLLAILFIIYRGNYYFDLLQVIMFTAIAFFVLVGMIITRQILTKISIVASSLRKAESSYAIPIDIQKDVVEFHEMSVSLNNLLVKLEQVTAELTQKSLGLATIKDLAEMINRNLSIDDQLNILLEKCMAVTGAQIGSVLTIEPETRQQYIVAKSTPISASELYRFRVCAAVGHGEELKKGALINIDNSVVKAALLEKTPLLIQDIANDPRTSKTNDPKYGPPSFLSMPIIIGDAVSAILNLAYKEKGTLFDDNDQQVLSIILRDIGFALENATLQARIKEQLGKIKQHHTELEKETERRNRSEMMLKHSSAVELKRVEETLAESEKKYRFITEKMTDIVWIQDMNLHTVYVSPSIETVLGFSPEERISQDVHEQLTPESMSVVRDVIAKELELEQQGQADPERKIVIELEYYHKDGSTRWMENMISGIRDDRGVLTGLHGVSRNITKRKQIEEALRQAEENFRQSIEHSPLGIRIANAKGETLYANRAILDIYGCDSVEEFLEDTIVKSLTPGSYAEYQIRMEKRRQGIYDEPGKHEISITNRKGELRHLQIFRKEVLWDGERQFQLIHQDITEQKQTEKELRESEERFRVASQNTTDVIWDCDLPQGTLEWFGDIDKMLGYGFGEFPRTLAAWEKAIHPDDRNRVMTALEKHLNARTPYQEEYRMVRKDGIIRYWTDRGVALRDDKGNAFRMIGSCTDMTERKHTEEELQKVRAQLLQSEKLAAIGQLSAGIAHEILNPVNIISMELQLLQTMENLPPTVLEELKICTDQINRIVNIAKDLKQTSRISEKKIVMADINDTISHILSLFSAQLNIEGIEVIAKYLSDAPAIAMDKEKIGQVIMNLISNATSAMEGKKQKTLRIKTERETVAGDYDHLKITVADTGTGIKSEHMSKIFDPFFTTKGQGIGTGLGLAISYSIVNDHGGRIWAENNEWGGASFYVTLPVQTDIENNYG